MTPRQRELIALYIEAKDRNRPELMSLAFAPDGRLEMGARRAASALGRTFLSPPRRKGRKERQGNAEGFGLFFAPLAFFAPWR